MSRVSRAERIVDSHQHFWQYSPEEYGWIGERDSAIRRDFLPGDLLREMRAFEVDDCVAVQARQTVGETEWLLSLAEANRFVRGVVGWLPLTEKETIAPLLERLCPAGQGTQSRLLSGIRHVVQGETDGFLQREDFNAGVARLAGFGLTYDILIYERQLPDAIVFADRHPNLALVLDHCAKPRIAAGEREPWASRLRELARRPNVSCKLSGLTTEANRETWTEADLLPYMETVLEAFGPDRLMFGSDWPVCTLACPYSRWAEIVRRVCDTLSPSERDAILGGNASRIYNLSDRHSE